MVQTAFWLIAGPFIIAFWAIMAAVWMIVAAVVFIIAVWRGIFTFAASVVRNRG